jgi:hypothetical protein
MFEHRFSPFVGLRQARRDRSNSLVAFQALGFVYASSHALARTGSHFRGHALVPRGQTPGVTGRIATDLIREADFLEEINEIEISFQGQCRAALAGCETLGLHDTKSTGIASTGSPAARTPRPKVRR